MRKGYKYYFLRDSISNMPISKLIYKIKGRTLKENEKASDIKKPRNTKADVFTLHASHKLYRYSQEGTLFKRKGSVSEN